ncbi:MAG: 16S rRNA processing protein RimM [Desulfocapsa sp.]|uniref:Ribosome maturation factor RimM n=1 Tax=Desulfotalea psychrophila TaxID=84980 RepID=A0ABS3AVX1_9BACT|nr:16S rRNA processing protein RimM [Desulfocapsa sp.]MBN4048909.1 16S rRNA processing protein RimM [bacterium AH-315-N22]MBN4068817.1 16S rRNA processing protein RimM [Desulfotalea psychrophila]
MADTFLFDTEKFVLIAKVSKAHGIKGELKLYAFSGQALSITQHRKLFLVSRQGELSPLLEVVRSRPGNKEAIVQFKGVNDRNDAEKLCGFGVLVQKDALPELDSDTFYLHELEGLQVKTEAGDLVGTVESFFNNGMQDIIVVKNGKSEVMIPLIPGIITERAKTCLTIAPPPGLLEINSDDSAKG